MVKQERAARTRQALIQAAAEVFAEEGFVTASLSTISRRAGVSNGALHFHFANKGMLADAVEVIGQISEFVGARKVGIGDLRQAKFGHALFLSPRA